MPGPHQVIHQIPAAAPTCSPTPSFFLPRLLSTIHVPFQHIRPWVTSPFTLILRQSTQSSVGLSFPVSALCED